MALVNAYVTLDELKHRLGITGDDSSRDEHLEQCANAASRQVDGLTGRRFYRATETRYFTADESTVLFVPDLGSVTTLKTDEDGDRTYEQTWATTDYDLEPYQGESASVPFTRILVAPNGTKAFPTIRRGVEVNGSWGYSATAPEAIREAVIVQAVRLFMRKSAPFGIAGTSALGQAQFLPKEDPEIRALIAPFRVVGLVSP